MDSKQFKNVFTFMTSIKSIPRSIFDNEFWIRLKTKYLPMVEKEGVEETIEHIYYSRYDEGFKAGRENYEYWQKNLEKNYPWYVKLALKINYNRPLKG